MYNTFLARNYIIHSIRRAQERYQVSLSENQLCEISDLILSGKAVLKKRSYKQRDIYKVSYNGKNFVVVFDHAQALPVTFLPHKCLRDMQSLEAA
jgi:hypothetical protein